MLTKKITYSLAAVSIIFGNSVFAADEHNLSGLDRGVQQALSSALSQQHRDQPQRHLLADSDDEQEHTDRSSAAHQEVGHKKVEKKDEEAKPVLQQLLELGSTLGLQIQPDDIVKDTPAITTARLKTLAELEEHDDGRKSPDHHGGHGSHSPVQHRYSHADDGRDHVGFEPWHTGRGGGSMRGRGGHSSSHRSGHLMEPFSGIGIGAFDQSLTDRAHGHPRSPIQHVVHTPQPTVAVETVEPFLAAELAFLHAAAITDPNAQRVMIGLEEILHRDEYENWTSAAKICLVLFDRYYYLRTDADHHKKAEFIRELGQKMSTLEAFVKKTLARETVGFSKILLTELAISESKTTIFKLIDAHLKTDKAIFPIHDGKAGHFELGKLQGTLAAQHVSSFSQKSLEAYYLFLPLIVGEINTKVHTKEQFTSFSTIVSSILKLNRYLTQAEGVYHLEFRAGTGLSLTHILGEMMARCRGDRSHHVTFSQAHLATSSPQASHSADGHDAHKVVGKTKKVVEHKKDGKESDE